MTDADDVNILGLEAFTDKMAPDDKQLIRMYCDNDECDWEEWATRKEAMKEHGLMHAMDTGHSSFSCDVDTYAYDVELNITLDSG